MALEMGEMKTKRETAHVVFHFVGMGQLRGCSGSDGVHVMRLGSWSFGESESVVFDEGMADSRSVEGGGSVGCFSAMMGVFELFTWLDGLFKSWFMAGWLIHVLFSGIMLCSGAVEYLYRRLI